MSYPLVARPRERYDRRIRWLLRRLTPGRCPGLHLTVGLLAAAGCVRLVWGLADGLLSNDPIVRLDRSVAAALHDAATPTATMAFLIVTALGSLGTVAVLGVSVAAYHGWKRRWPYVGAWIVALAGGTALNQLLKAAFARPRPVFDDPLLVESTYSFPSGHAMESTVVYGLLAYFAVRALADLAGAHGGRVGGRDPGAPDRVFEDVPGRPLPERRRGGGRVVERVHHRSEVARGGRNGIAGTRTEPDPTPGTAGE